MILSAKKVVRGVRTPTSLLRTIPIRASASQVEVFVDGKPIKVDPSYTIFQACHEAGVTVPRFCFHERLAVAGNCRMCLVEVERSPKPVASCAMPVMPGMKIKTTSEKTRIARGGVMEFLLANHPLDCPICDQGGECDLQDISQVYGYRQGRFMEYKRAVQDKDIGPLVKTVMNRCIHCTRCIRFTELVAGDYTLGTTGRGKDTQIGTYIEELTSSQLSANIVDLCPVGALTNKPYAFNARPWELKTNYSCDVLEGGIQPSIELNNRGSELMRILPRINENVNEEWISDKSRHGFDGLKRQRLSVPMMREKDGTYRELSWEEAFALFKSKLMKTPTDQIAGIIGPFMDVEACTAFRDLMHRVGCEQLEVRSDTPKLSADIRSQYLMNSRIVGVHDADLILFIGCNPRSEAPVFNSRIRRQVLERGIEVAVLGTPAELTYQYTHLGNNTQTLVELAEGRHPFCAKIANAKLPMLIIGAPTLERPDGDILLNVIHTMVEHSNILSSEKKWNGFNILHKEASRVGALDLGISPNPMASTKSPKFVFLLGADDIRVDEIPEDAFVVYQGHTGEEGALFADLILPGAAYTEKTATYVNSDGMVQRGRGAVSSPGMSKEDWMILRALSEELGIPLPYDSVQELRYRIAELAPHLLKPDYIEPSGFEDLVLRGKQQFEGELDLTNLTDHIDNFYMTDAITRSSALMAKCSKAFNPKKLKNFRATQID